MPQNPPTEHVPQPVKKRGRFSNLSVRQEQNLPTHQRNVPAGFVRDLLDEEDSEDDPDFEGDIELSDEDEDALDDPFATDLVPEYPHSDRSRPTSAPSDAQGQASVGFPTHDHLPDDDPEFEVDSLDSTDNEDDDNNFRPDGPRQSAQSYAAARLGQDNEFVVFGDIELNSEDEEDDPDFEANLDPSVSRRPAQIYDDDDEHGQSEARDDEYVQFLMGLLADNGERPQKEAETSGTDAACANTANVPAEGGVNVAGDDDDDFDYLRASAMMQDDPLEYRDDLHVSRKEVAQLLFNNNESTLRRQTRRLRAKKAPAHSGRRPRHGEQVAPPASFPVLPALPGSSAPPQSFLTGTVAPQAAGQSSANNYSMRIPQPLIAPHHTSFISLSPAQMFKFNEQFDVYLQILTHIHAVCKKKVRAKNDLTISGLEPGKFDKQCDPRIASEKSNSQMKRLLENHRVSTSYHAMVQAHITKMKAFSEGLLHRKGQALFNCEASKPTVYNKPAIGLIESFLRECETADTSTLPGSALKPFEPYERQDVRQALAGRPDQRLSTVSGAREGWFAWTAADDNLLAMTIAKYGREFGDYAKDLLPHRLEEDCQVRVRYLASRRCQDNPVKRQVVHISTPLNRDELKLVEAGLQRFGGKIDDPNVWKQIQGQLLPTREWSHLQKLWLWRETRRKYKATYRAKLNRKKALKQGTVVR